MINLTKLQQTNNITLTVIGSLSAYFCNRNELVTRYLVLVSKRNVDSLGASAFFYAIILIKESTSELNKIGCSTFTTCPEF